MTPQPILLPGGRRWRVALGALLAPPLGILAFYALSSGDFEQLAANPLLTIAITYALMGIQGVTLALALEYGIQPRVRTHATVVLCGLGVGALCGVAFPLVWLNAQLFLVCAGAGGASGIIVGALVRWMWWRAAQQGAGQASAPPQMPGSRPWLIWLGIGTALGVACLVLLLATFVWLAG